MVIKRENLKTNETVEIKIVETTVDEDKIALLTREIGILHVIHNEYS
jgi:hypothetical protein